MSFKRIKTEDKKYVDRSPSIPPSKLITPPMSLGKETLDMEENSQQSDSSSDSGRLQMDISQEDGIEDVNNEENRKIKKECYDRETPESIASDDHINDTTDPATTQLWQALAQTTVNGGGTEATQLLRRMINCRSLGIPMPMMTDQPMSLTKVSFFFKFCFGCRIC